MTFYPAIAKVSRDDTGALTSIPVLIAEDGPLMPLVHYLLWRSHDRSLSWMRKVIQGVQLFLQYMDANRYSLGDPQTVLNTFVQRLYSGTIGPDGLDPSGLYWRPMSAKTVAPLLSCLSDFSDWLVDRQQATGVNPVISSSRYDALLSEAASYHRRSRAFLGHTYHAKAASQQGKARSTLAKRAPKIADEGDAPAFPEKNFTDLILHGFVKRGYETHPDIGTRLNLRDCLITLLMHGAGLRLSECFHLWVHDVIPDPQDPTVALVRVHHPSEGQAPDDWLDERGRPFKGNRAAYLAGRYALRPRDEVAGHLHAGWKEPALDEAYYLYAYWFPRDLGRIFLSLWNRYLVELVSLSRPHPYAFVTSRGPTAGEMYSMTAYHQAYRQAVARIGLVACKWMGTTPHGHRHAYARRLMRANVEPRFRQKALHHKSLESQVVYTTPNNQDVTLALDQASKALERLPLGGEQTHVFDLEKLLTVGFEDIDPQGLLSGPAPKLQRRP